MVGLTNAYNFMDGMAAGLGGIVGLPIVSLLGVLLASSSLGFLGHNWQPARIFMSDVGSAFLGFTLAVLPVMGGLVDPHLPVAGILVVWPFVFDATFTLLRRLRRGENIFAAHRSHLYQRLVIAGYSHRAVTILYACLAIMGVFLAFLWVWDVAGSGWLVLGVPCLLSWGVWYFTVRTEARSVSP